MYKCKVGGGGGGWCFDIMLPVFKMHITHIDRCRNSDTKFLYICQCFICSQTRLMENQFFCALCKKTKFGSNECFSHIIFYLFLHMLPFFLVSEYAPNSMSLDMHIFVRNSLAFQIYFSYDGRIYSNI